MTENYIKPQSPLKKINKETGEVNYIYPITTPDQVVMEDGRRLNAVLDELNENTPDIDLSELGIITIDLEGATDGTPATIDADTFQGYTIDKFVMYNINGEDGDIDTTIDADMLGGKTESELSVANSAKLGGKTAESYVLKEEISDVLNGITADKVTMANGYNLELTLNGIWFDFTDADGNPTDEPHAHWLVDEETGEIATAGYLIAEEAEF